MLHVHPRSQHHHPTGRLQPLFTGQQRREGIWLLRWQGSVRSQPCKRRGGASSSASPVCRTWEPLFFFFFFPSCVCTDVCTGFLGKTLAPWPWDPHGAVRGVQSPVLMHGEYPGACWPHDEPVVARVSSRPQDLHPAGHQ